MSTIKAHIGVNMPVELAERLRSEADARRAKEGRFVGMSQIVVEAVRQYLSTVDR